MVVLFVCLLSVIQGIPSTPPSNPPFNLDIGRELDPEAQTNSIVCNESVKYPFVYEGQTSEETLERIQCFYEKGGEIIVDPSGNDTDGCGSGGSPCRTIEYVKREFRYNTKLRLVENLESSPFDLRMPPANLTGLYAPGTDIFFLTFFSVIGAGKDKTFVKIVEEDYDASLNIIGAWHIPVVAYVSGPNTTFSISKGTGLFDGVPIVDETVFIWIRDGAMVNIEDVKFTGSEFPTYLFEQSGGYLSLIRTEISPSGTNLVKGPILFWNDETRQSLHNSSHTHIGSWTIEDSKFENIKFLSERSLLDDPNNKECTLTVLIRNTNFTNITSQLPGAVSGHFRNADKKALIFSYGNTRGTKTITDASFRNLDSTGHTAPLAVLTLPVDDEVFTGLGLSFTGCTGGSASGTLAAYVSIRELNTIYGIKDASDNYVRNPDNTQSPSNTFTPMSDDVIICIDGLDVNCPEDTKTFPVWVIIVIVVVAVVVVAVVVVIVAVAVFLHKKKYSTLSDEEDYNESSSSSIRSAEKGDELDDI